MELYSVTKKNEILSFAGKWIDVEYIILSEVNQIQKAKKTHAFSHRWNIDLIQMNQQVTLLGGHM
jgi:hypothetical protein